MGANTEGATAAHRLVRHKASIIHGGAAKFLLQCAMVLARHVSVYGHSAGPASECLEVVVPGRRTKLMM